MPRLAAAPALGERVNARLVAHGDVRIVIRCVVWMLIVPEYCPVWMPQLSPVKLVDDCPAETGACSRRGSRHPAVNLSRSIREQRPEDASGVEIPGGDGDDGSKLRHRVVNSAGHR